jgi:hypothetical protein
MCQVPTLPQLQQLLFSSKRSRQQQQLRPWAVAACMAEWRELHLAH